MNTILIAEDEKFIRKGLVTMVRRSGVPVETILEARDGEEALEKLEGQYRQKQDQRKEQGQRLLRTLRHLMLEQDTSSPEWREQAQRCRDSFFPGPYVGFCAGDCPRPLPEGVLRLHAVGAVFLYAVPQGDAEELAALLPAPVGRGGIYAGAESLHLCYRQAHAAWRDPFSPGSPAESCRPRRSGPCPSRWSSSPGWRGCPGARRSCGS